MNASVEHPVRAYADLPHLVFTGHERETAERFTPVFTGGGSALIVDFLRRV